jgi:capsid protein
VIAAAETAADFAAFLFTEAPAGGESDAAEPFESLQIEQRMLTTLPAGWNVSQLRAEQPATSYADFKHEILNEICRCLNMPFNIAAGNSSSYNYASGRLDHQTYYKALRVDQSHLENVVLDHLLAAWFDEAVLIPGLLPPLPGLIANWPHQYFWDGHEHVDPTKESTAQGLRLANHTTTLADEYARRGQDWESQLRQRAREVALMSELGLTPNQIPSSVPLENIDDEAAPADVGEI